MRIVFFFFLNSYRIFVKRNTHGVGFFFFLGVTDLVDVLVLCFDEDCFCDVCEMRVQLPLRRHQGFCFELLFFLRNLGFTIYIHFISFFLKKDCAEFWVAIQRLFADVVKMCMPRVRTTIYLVSVSHRLFFFWVKDGVGWYF